MPRRECGVRHVVLASASPRRRDLLRVAGFLVVVRPADIDERLLPGEGAHRLVERLAKSKVRAVARNSGTDAVSQDAVSQNAVLQDAVLQDVGLPVIAADTTVALDDLVLNKPADDEDARRMLRKLSGRSHEVLTGLAVRMADREHCTVVSTQVSFRSLDDEDIEAYLGAGEHMDKAGAYGVQGAGSVLIDRVDGSMTNVVGLPMTELFSLLRRVGALA